MSTTEGMEEKSGISRRDLIKKGAVAGAVFWSVPVIESVTSRAAAQSGCVSFNASWLYVIYTYNGVTYYTGFSKADTTGQCTAASYPANTGNNALVIGPCGGIYYELSPTQGTPALVTYGTSSSTTTTAATYVGYPNCNNYVTLHGGDVTPVLSDVHIVAAFCFGASSLSGTCASTNSTCANCG